MSGAANIGGADRRSGGAWGVVVPFAIVTLIWGSTWLVIRDQLAAVPPSWSVTYRFAAGSIAMAGYALATRTSLALPRPVWGITLLLGLAQFVVNFNLVYRAEAHITSGLVAVIFALLVIPNALLGRIFLGQQLSRGFIAGSAVALAGIGLLFAHEWGAGGAAGARTGLGIALSLLAVLSASSANILQALPRVQQAPLVSVMCWSMITGTIGNALWAWITSGPPAWDPRPAYLAGIVYLGVAASAVAFMLYYPLIRRIGAARAAYSGVIIPVIAMALSTLFEGYRWTPTAMAGGGLALIGLVLALSARSPAR